MTQFQLSGASLDQALKHIETFGDTDILPVPFEYKAIRHQWARVRSYLEGVDIGQWSTSPARTCLSPKHTHSFRTATQLNPLDTIVFTALVMECGRGIEEARVAIDKEIVHSYRFDPDGDGRIYSQDTSFASFQARCLELSGENPIVVVTDIADFFPRLYLHPLENAINSATGGSIAGRSILRMVKQWNQNVSYGIPVGPDASRILSEIAIDDVDRCLLGEQFKYCRYSDDFRIFVESKRDAHEALSKLASFLFDNHGLTLQGEKTRVLESTEFVNRFVNTEAAMERGSLFEKFQSLLETLEIADSFMAWYADIDYEDLDEDQRKAVDELNLAEMMKEQATGEEALDLPLCRFLLRRLAQMRNSDPVDEVVGNLDTLHPCIRDVVQYLVSLADLGGDQQKAIGERMLGALREGICGHLEYHRAWLLELFASPGGWNHVDLLPAIYSDFSDQFTRRAAIAALGTAGESHWFKSKKRTAMDWPAWERRAFLAYATCLPGDEAGHWYRSVRRNFDVLDDAVVEWALAGRP